MGAGRVTAVIIGALLILLAFGLGAGAAVAGVLAAGQGSSGFLSVPQERYEVDTAALTVRPIDVGTDAGAEGDVGTVQVRAESADPSREVFLGVAPTAEVDRWLAGVAHSELRRVDFDPFSAGYRNYSGASDAPAPAEQGFWVAAAQGSGRQELQWPLTEGGTWTVVVMNADGSPPLSVDLQMGLRSDIFAPVALGLLAAAAVSFLVGVALVLLVVLAGRGRGPHPEAGPAPPPSAGSAVQTYPARLTGEPDSRLSRWFWLVKWFLAIPHWILLFFLWIAFLVVTVAAGFAILFTGRYPYRIFTFTTGVLRWQWRVRFYATRALGTDRYPPFSLERTDYPADFEVDYPDRLSRGLVLVKWWLLVLPQALVVAILSGGATWVVMQDGRPGQAARWLDGGAAVPGYGTGADPDWFDGGRTAAGGIGLLGLLVLINAVILLFSGTYQRPLFDLVMGLNRWTYRVLAYTALLTDAYPPFRLDQGPQEPAAAPPTSPSGSPVARPGAGAMPPPVPPAAPPPGH